MLRVLRCMIALCVMACCGFRGFRVRNLVSVAAAGMMSDDELLQQTIQSAGSAVGRGKVRRKKDTRRGARGGLAELASLR